MYVNLRASDNSGHTWANTHTNSPPKKQADLALADVNQNTALHLALMERNLDVAQALIRAGAPLDIPNRSNKVCLFVYTCVYMCGSIYTSIEPCNH